MQLFSVLAVKSLEYRPNPDLSILQFFSNQFCGNAPYQGVVLFPCVNLELVRRSFRWKHVYLIPLKSALLFGHDLSFMDLTVYLVSLSWQMVKPACRRHSSTVSEPKIHTKTPRVSHLNFSNPLNTPTHQPFSRADDPSLQVFQNIAMDSACDFSSSQKELDTQPTKEAIEASANLAKLIQQHSKTQGPQMATNSEKPTTSKPVEEMGTVAPSSPAPRRVPTAQMVSEIPATSPLGPRRNPTSLTSPQAFFPATASASAASAASAPIISSSPEMAVTKQAAKNHTPKKTGLTTPAPATAPSASRDAALADHVQNTNLLSRAKSPPNGVKKRKFLTSDSVSDSEEKHGRGRLRTRPEELPLQQRRLSALFPRASIATSSRFTPSSLLLKQTQATAVNIKGDLRPEFCSEDPRLWPGRGDYVAFLQEYGSKPETFHSDPVRACINHEAHEDKPRGHGVCATCRRACIHHIKATRPELFGIAWWPLCNACSEYALRHATSTPESCSCGKSMLCFECQSQEVESRHIKNGVEASSRRRTFVGMMDGDEHVVKMGWPSCECGGVIEPNYRLMKCVGCQGLTVRTNDAGMAIARETAVRKKALGWAC